MDSRLPRERRVARLRNVGRMGHHLPGYDQSARLRPCHLPPAAEAAIQVLHYEHRSAVRHAVSTHHDRVLFATRMRGKDLTWHIRSPRLHRIPADDRRKYPENVVSHSANRLEFATCNYIYSAGADMRSAAWQDLRPGILAITKQK